MSLEQLKQIPFAITAILQGLRLYPAEHPHIQRQLENSIATLTPLITRHERLSISLIDGTLFLNETPCLEQLKNLQELTRLFERQQLQAVELLDGLDSRQLLFFCQELPQLLGGNFIDRLENAGITAIRATPLEEEAGVEAIYQQAMKTVEDVCNDVRLGRIPSSKKVIKTVKGMVKTILKEPYSLLAMAMLKDYDNYTFSHSVNVSVIAMSVGSACGLPQQQLYELGMGGLLHDLGKMTIDHEIVAKPGRLSDDELEEMKQHPENGAKIVAAMEKIPADVIDIVNNHHLRFDRTGYPVGNRDGIISTLADMTSIADTYDAMTTIRCYQRPRSPKQAVAMMAELGGNQLHPEYLKAFLDYLGPYPVGTLVRLKDGSVGLICDQNRSESGSLTLKILFTADGKKQLEPPLRQLPDSSTIVAEVDPALKGVNLEDYLP
ncbi:MAG TPA: HD-GYP domain-containing protein [Malonomonas sp.]